MDRVFLFAAGLLLAACTPAQGAAWVPQLALRGGVDRRESALAERAGSARAWRIEGALRWPLDRPGAPLDPDEPLRDELATRERALRRGADPPASAPPDEPRRPSLLRGLAAARRCASARLCAWQSAAARRAIAIARHRIGESP